MTTQTIIAIILCILIILSLLSGLVAVIYYSYRIAKNREKLSGYLNELDEMYGNYL